ncbi:MULTISPECIES: SNF2-related protein [unclassified Lentimicrobium]|uniref:SNF2-related protein n=1 Tax=unclassified Lentimicrobium TaxID=2677434 RepID=UPI001551EDBD|nr:MULTISPECIES: SNF2-related protein [unclassified Lentimicrobium]NPD47155.1 hypothetical protein [Lentimicrobium sp. S6]NPD83680.1 hypothetical protein [Lentimicrobium sp. L6]
MNKEHHQELLAQFIEHLEYTALQNKLSYRKGMKIYEMGQCRLMTSSTHTYSFSVEDDYEDFKVDIKFREKDIDTQCSCHSIKRCSHVYAASFQTQQEMSRTLFISNDDAVQYSRDGMIKRVIQEREERALKENYEMDFGDNIFGEHLLRTNQNKSYHLSFYDFKKRLGYCSCPDYQTNKLETCKHLIYAFKEFSNHHDISQLPQQTYPFLEIFRHPLNDYQIAWFYPHQPEQKAQSILDKYFNEKQLFKKDKLHLLHHFLEDIQDIKSVNIRPEVKSYISNYFESKSLSELYSNKEIPGSLLKKPIFEYQKQGILFIASRKGSILADEIGLGKTAQALGAALLKIKYSGLLDITILAPRHLHPHWEKEMKKWIPDDKLIYFNLTCFENISQHNNCDFLIIDEAQKIDDYESGILSQIHRIEYKHILLITDSKFEISLMKYYAMSAFIDKYLLTPLWELSYKHCLFDSSDNSKILAYHNLEIIAKKLEGVYLRREKSEILNQFPKADLVRIPVDLDNELKLTQSNLSKRLLKWVKQDRINHYDLLQFKNNFKQLLSLSQTTRNTESSNIDYPKPNEFRHFISHKLNLNPEEKVIIYASSKTIQHQIQRILLEERKSAIVLEADSNINPDEFQFLICSDQSEIKLPEADHFIYYHLPIQNGFLQERIKIQTENQVGIDKSRFYIFETVSSLESIIFQWENSKPLFLKQLLSFITEKDNHHELSLRLKEELAHEFKNLILKEEDIADLSIQTNLFGEKLNKKSAVQLKHTDSRKHLGLNDFFNHIRKIYPVLEKLTDDEKDIIFNGKMSLKADKNEIIIHLKKS